MRASARAAALLAGSALLIACADSRTHVCTLIASPAGIGVTIAPRLANTVADATISVCWDGRCRTSAIQLREPSTEAPATPGDPVMTTGIPTAAPATHTPTTPQRLGPPAFALVPDLPQEPVRVTLVLKDMRGATVLERQITVTPKPTYPNGRRCSSSGPQAGLNVRDDGLLTVSPPSAD